MNASLIILCISILLMATGVTLMILAIRSLESDSRARVLGVALLRATGSEAAAWTAVEVERAMRVGMRAQSLTLVRGGDRSVPPLKRDFKDRA